MAPRTPFDLFRASWGLALAMHYLDRRPLEDPLVLVSGLATFLLPRSPLPFVACLCANVASTVRELPALSNHRVLSLLVCAVLLAAGVAAAIRRRPMLRAAGWDEAIAAATAPI